jgi:thiamine-phosphate pyrophosphorylase
LTLCNGIGFHYLCRGGVTPPKIENIDMQRIKDYSLYFITSQEYTKARSSLEVAQSAINGGVDILQMREKHKSKEELLELGKALQLLCRESNVMFIVNDDPFLASDLNADGLHLGQEDIKKYPLAEVRNIIGKDKIMGVSTHSIEQFKQAKESDCDYIAFGPIFPTKTKDYSLGTNHIQDVLSIADKPVVFIGGIDLINIDILLQKGAKNIAVIRAIAQAEDISSRVKELRMRIKRYRKEEKDASKN